MVKRLIFMKMIKFIEVEDDSYDADEENHKDNKYLKIYDIGWWGDEVREGYKDDEDGKGDEVDVDRWRGSGSNIQHLN